MLKFPSIHRIWLGRGREMSELESGLDEVARGRGSLFLITGEPGIGKTRLADEAGRLAAAQGVSVHWGRAWETGGAPCYWPFIQALRTISHERAPVDLLVAPTHSPVERFQLFEAVDALLRAATPPPRVIVLDDLHAADPSSLELMHFIARDLRSRPLMLIGTYREAEARLAPEIQPLLARVAREARMLPLLPLDRSQVHSFIAQATGTEPSLDRVDRLYLKTEGNPLFLRELLRLPCVQSEHSDTIRAVVRGRVELLSHEARATLEAAAVLGREFTATELATVIGASEVDARAGIEPATYAGIVETLEDPPRWRFTHHLLGQALYDDLPHDRRAALHRAAAAELCERPEGSPLARVAHHLLRAIPLVSPLEAARAASSAAEQAMGVLAFEDALGFHESAAKLLEGQTGQERALFEAVLGIGLAFMRMAEVERGREACRRATALARRLGDGELLARAVLTSGYEHVPEVRNSARIAELEEALALLPPGDGALRARCMAQLAADRAPEPDMRPLTELAQHAIAMARRVQDEDALRQTLSAASFAMAVYADPAQRIPVIQETLRLALSAGDRRVALRAHAFLTGGFWELGDPAAARPHMLAADALLQEFRHGRFHWLTSIAHAFGALSEGRFEEAKRRYAEAWASVERDEARGLALAGAGISAACVMERCEQVDQLESETRSTFGSMGPLASCLGEMLIAQLHGRAGNASRAAAQLATCTAHPLFDDIAEPAWLAMLTDACHLASDEQLAHRLFRVLLPRAQRFVFLGPLTACVDLPYARHLGLLAQTLGRVDDAITHLEHAEALAARAGMRAHLARIAYELARALLVRNRPGDRDRASTLVGQARLLATELGQTGLLPRLAALNVDSTLDFSRNDHPVPLGFTLRREGDVWALDWANRTVRLRDSRGLSLLARLVDAPGQEFHVLQLMATQAGPQDSGDAGPVLDGQAVQGYRQRLLDLRQELAEAEACADGGRAERAQDELDFLTRELARALGLGGRERRTGQAAERARTAVQKRLRDAVRRIATELPELGLHLEQTLRTGLFCGYFPQGRSR